MRALLIVIMASCWSLCGADFHVTQNGTASGDGSMASPWSFETALTNPPALRGGDTVHLHEGVYSNFFQANIFLATASNAPVIFTPYLGERAIIQGQLNLNSSSNVWFVRLEVTDPGKTNRVNPFDTVRGGGAGSKFINCLIHDCCIGLGNGAMEAYGNVMWNTGKSSLEHGIYWQNAGTRGRQIIQHNLIGFSSGFGIHSYSSSGPLTDITIDGNATWLSGAALDDSKAGVLIGGGKPIINGVVTENQLYEGSRGIYLGSQVVNSNAVIANNYIRAGYPLFFVQQFLTLTLTNNLFYSYDHSPYWMAQPDVLYGPHNWDRNDYRNTLGYWNGVFALFGGGYTNFADWKALTGVDPNSTYSGIALTNRVVVFPNRYEPKRANIVVWNSSLQDTVNVDLSRVLNPGDGYLIHNAQDWFGSVWKGSYSGAPISLPMTNLTAAAHQYFQPNVTNRSTGPFFGAFVVIGRPPPVSGLRTIP